MSMDLDPLLFFDAQSNGLRLNSKGSEYNLVEEAEILRFIRTPEGIGVGALRVGGGGNAWGIVEGGTKLVRFREWERADFVVVLAKGTQPYSRLQWVSYDLTVRSTICDVYKRRRGSDTSLLASPNSHHP